MKKAEEYITEWCDKTYGGGKELGDWTTSEVMKFANDYAKITMRESAKEAWLHMDKEWCSYTGDIFEEDNSLVYFNAYYYRITKL